jgi:hypothetical protein
MSKNNYNNVNCNQFEDRDRLYISDLPPTTTTIKTKMRQRDNNYMKLETNPNYQQITDKEQQIKYRKYLEKHQKSYNYNSLTMIDHNNIYKS